MSLHGVVRKVGGTWAVEYAAAAYSEPRMDIVTWPVLAGRVHAPYGPAPELVDGLAVTWEHGRPWQAYAQGNYLLLETEKEGMTRSEPVPCPKVRKGIATRWQNGKWEKCLKSGWVTA